MFKLYHIILSFYHISQCSNLQVPVIVKDILYLTAVLNSCMNPIIYGVEKENENSTKTGFQRHSKKGLPLLGEVSAHTVLEHQHHQDPLLQQAKSTKIANLQICKKCKFANLHFLQKKFKLQKSPKLQNGNKIQ